MTRSVQVESPSGRIEGIRDREVDTFLGLPYATVPQRFAAPGPVRREGTLTRAIEWGAAPYQRPPEYARLAAAPSEDCLNLNIWRPVDADGPLPVLVWLYGGGFAHGANSLEGTSGAPFASTGRVIVVSPNYRVGAFGWAQLADHGGDLSAASNLGLQDQIAALRWVHENIAAFGGDPGRVTVMGESAGGFSAAALLAAPVAHGLMHAVAMFSGCASRVTTEPRARAIAGDLIARLGVTPGELADIDAQILDDAQNAVITDEISARNDTRPRALGIVDDSGIKGGVLDGHPMDVVAEGGARDIRMLLSTTQDEIAVFRDVQPQYFTRTTRVSLVDEVARWGIDDARAAAIADAYLTDAGEPALARERLLTDWIYRLPAARMARAQARSGGTAHLMVFGRVGDEPAVHGSDMPAILGNPPEEETTDAAARRVAVSRAIVNFAAGTDPEWPAATTDALPARRFGADAETVDDYERVEALWEGIDRP